LRIDPALYEMIERWDNMNFAGQCPHRIFVA
jgi:hypothetical protein